MIKGVNRFGVQAPFQQVYRPIVKGINYHYLHPFVTPFAYHRQIDAEYEVVEPPDDGSPTYSGGRIGLHRSMKNKHGRFDDRDLIDLVRILTSVGIL